jgi:hypothetical protein
MRFWSGTAFRHGPNEAVKYTLVANAQNPASSLGNGADILSEDLSRQLQTSNRPTEFEFGVQMLDADRMRRWGRQHDEIYWVENAAVDWPEDQAPFHKIGKLTLDHAAPLSEEEANQFYIDVTEHSTPDSHPLGSVNRARWFGESASKNARLGLVAPGAVVDPKALPGSRMGAPLPAPPQFSWKRLGDTKLSTVFYAGSLVVATVVILGFFGFAWLGYRMSHGLGQLPVENVSEVIYQKRGWDAGLEAPDRQTYYYTPQGAGLEDIRYSWFVNLELPWGQQRLADPAVMNRYGFLVDPPTKRNPNALPVGFTKHFDTHFNDEMLDVTCATCHTGQLQITTGGKTRALRIDGGQGDHAFTDASIGEFLPTLVASLISTIGNPSKFDRFARKVLGANYPNGRYQLFSDVRGVTGHLVAIAANENKPWHKLFPTREGYGRTDALARIGNTVFGYNLAPENFKIGNAPVSYPAIWNIWKFDWVQYNASVSQPMARNIGEAMGVGARYALTDAYGKPLPYNDRFRSTALVDSLHTIETTLRKLTPPVWDEGLLGKIDSAKAATGKTLFAKNCETCHGPHVAPDALKKLNAPGKTAAEPEWLVKTLCASDIGTDPNAAQNFDTVKVDITRTGMSADSLRAVARRTGELANARMAVYLGGEITRLRRFGKDSAAQLAKTLKDSANLRGALDQQLSGLNPKALPMGQALSYLGTMIRNKAYADGHYTKAQQDTLDGFGILDQPQIINGYKARPLAGIWATPPFLHNGSVPTIYDLISPPASRPVTFAVGTREFDTVKVGLATPANPKAYQTFDTRLTGNHNSGHEFGEGYIPYVTGKPDPVQPRKGLIGPLLSHDEKMAIIEYLKIRDDDKDGSKIAHVPSVCWDK